MRNDDYRPMLPATIAYAHAGSFPLATVHPANRTGQALPGDVAAFLVSLVSNGHESQWLATVQLDALTPREAKMRPPIRDIVRYTTTGRELRYRASERIALQLKLAGPFNEGQSAASHAPVEEERVLVNPGFLELGLDRTCGLWLRMQEDLKNLTATGELGPNLALSFEASIRPFPDSVIARTRAVAERIRFTPEDERAFYGMELALEAFAKLIESSPAAGRIFNQVAERPTFWSMIGHAGLESRISISLSDIRRVPGASWKVESPVYRLPFEMQRNGEPALAGALTVTAPRPPLLACAGILSASASSPHELGQKLFLRLLSDPAGPTPSSLVP